MLDISVKILNDISNFFNIKLQHIHRDSKEIISCTIGENTINGFINIIFELLKKSTVLTIINNVEIYQWLEYSQVYASKLDSCTNYQKILDELDDVLAEKTYLALNEFTVADLVLFYYLHNTIANMSYIDKEKYLNLCRWFDNLQHNEKLRNKTEIIQFNTNHLSLLVPTKH